MRFLFNLLGGLALAAALVFAVADIAASLADDRLRLASLGEALASLGLAPAMPVAGGEAAVDLAALVLAWPASLVVGALAFVLLFLGRPPRRRRIGRLAG